MQQQIAQGHDVQTRQLFRAPGANPLDHGHRGLQPLFLQRLFRHAPFLSFHPSPLPALVRFHQRKPPQAGSAPACLCSDDIIMNPREATAGPGQPVEGLAGSCIVT
jgi:hypothetical protein